MREKEFWTYVNKLQAKNRPKLLAAGLIRTDDQRELEEAKRMYGDSSECIESEELPKSKIVDFGKLLRKKNVSLKAKRMIIMTLAHEDCKEALNALKIYNRNPDKELKYFAKFALQECEWWNE